ncbi:MAG TPA: hypothetical protein VI076_10960, partial [Actinopolymorphaceae bacterium]
AHAWPELYFEGAGWVRFEPTPTVSGRRGTTPSWARPGNLVGELEDPRTRGRDHSPSPEPTTAVDRRAGTGADGSGSWPWIGRLAGVVVPGVLLLALVASVPMVARTIVRRRRLAHLRAPRDDPAAWARTAWAELADQSRDLGYRWAHGVSVRQPASRPARDAALDGPARAALEDLVRAVERAAYARAGSWNPSTAVAAGGEEPGVLVRQVCDGLVTHRGRRERLRALVFPASILAHGQDVLGSLLARLARMMRWPARALARR